MVGALGVGLLSGRLNGPDELRQSRCVPRLRRSRRICCDASTRLEGGAKDKYGLDFQRTATDGGMTFLTAISVLANPGRFRRLPRGRGRFQHFATILDRTVETIELIR